MFQSRTRLSNTDEQYPYLYTYAVHFAGNANGNNTATNKVAI